MYILDIFSAIKKSEQNNSYLKVFLFENYYRQIGFAKEDSYC